MSAAVQLPARYAGRWRDPFEAPIMERLVPGTAVLDIGSGRHPAIPVDKRPADVRYVGLDLSQDELEAAETGAYTEMLEADATLYQPSLAGQFDLVVSWQVLEHVQDLEATVGNIKRYLRPGGTFVTLFSGTWSAFGVINRVLPNKLGARIVDPIMRRTERNIPVFPAHYDKCHASALRPMFSTWAEADIRGLYGGAGYFGFARPVQRVYLAYENFIERRGIDNLATHYLIVARA